MDLPLILTLAGATALAFFLLMVVIRNGPAMSNELVPEYSSSRARNRGRVRQR